MQARTLSIYASGISIIGFITQLTGLNAVAKNILLIVSLISLFFMLFVSFLKTDVVNRKRLIKTGKHIILNTKEKLVLFGGDLSWTEDYLEAITTIKQENKIIEIYFPQSKYNDCKDNSVFSDRIKKLKLAGAKVYSLNEDYGLRCIIVDPDSYSDSDNMEIMITDRLKRHKTNSLKNKYSLKYFKHSNTHQKNICKSYITNYNYVKKNIFKEI